MTDALSEWFIEHKQSAVDEIHSWKSQEIYENRIIELRKNDLQNDDSAILVIELENDNTNSLNYKDITIFRLPQDGLELLTIEKSTEIEDPAISISQKFIQEEDGEKRAELEQRLLEKRLAQEQHIDSMIDVFERKISETKKPGKTKKKKKSLWKKITNFFAASNDGDDENEGSDHHSDTIDKTSASDVNSITDKF